MTTETQLTMNLRWMIRRDMPFVFDIENVSFDYPWREQDFYDHLRRPDCVAFVAEHQERIAGFVVYELLPDSIHIMNLAVAPWALRKGVATALIQKIAKKASRNAITAHVMDSNLDAHLFFKAAGFRAVEVVHNYFEEAGFDAYLFRVLI